MIEGWEHTDIVNAYLAILHSYGLAGIIPFIFVLWAAMRQLFIAFRKSTLSSERWFIWCFAGSMFGLLVAMMTASLFGPTVTVFYIMLGFCGIMPKLVNRQDSLVFTHARSDMLDRTRVNI